MSVVSDAAAAQTLLQRLGGADVLLDIVETLYERLVADDHLAPMFHGVHVIRLVKHQHAFLQHAFSARAFDGAKMRAAHARLIRDKGLCVTHFDSMVGHMEQALRQHQVAEALISDALHVMVQYRVLFPGGEMAAGACNGDGPAAASATALVGERLGAPQALGA